MSIKIKLRENHKAIVKFTHPVDEQYFINMMRQARDNGMPHPMIILKNRDGGTIPPLPKPVKMPPAQPPPQVTKKEPEIIKKPEVKKSD